MAKIEVSDKGTNYVTVYVYELSSLAKYAKFYKNDVLDTSNGTEYQTFTTTSMYYTFYDLSPNTYYTFSVDVYQSNWTKMSFTNNSCSERTLSAGTLTIYYRDGNTSSTERVSGTTTIRGPFKTDWTFVGWSTSLSSPDVDYVSGESFTYQGSTSSTMNLYAVYKKETTIYCYFISGYTNKLDYNTRTKIQYRCNTSNVASSTNFFNSFFLPSFSSSNITITTTTPNREWDNHGWRLDTEAGPRSYLGGQIYYCDDDTSNFYAVYKNTCSITYNSNGGSGTMTVSSGTAYYNASGNYTTPELEIKDCAFTPPTGKKFGYWNVKADGTGTSYDAGSSVLTNHNVIFYAIWTAGRPSNWSWTTNVKQGVAMTYTGSGSSMVVKPLTATEWLNFTNRIKEFYQYLGLTVDSTYWYRAVNGVASGSPMTMTQANGARYLINQLDPPIAVPAAVTVTNKVITAAFINGLKNSLNSIT